MILSNSLKDLNTSKTRLSGNLFYKIISPIKSHILLIIAIFETMVLGYSRVSTWDQKLDMQVHDLKKFGCEKVYKEKKSAAKERPVLDKMFSFLREGDVLVVWRLDRLGRSVKDLISLMNKLEKMKVNFVSLKENINTSTATGRLIFHVMAALAEFERDLIAERTKEGLRLAKMKGHFAGRPKGLNEKSKSKARDAWKLARNPDFSIGDIIGILQISKATYYRYIEWASKEEFKKKYEGKTITYKFFTGKRWEKRESFVDANLIDIFHYRHFEILN